MIQGGQALCLRLHRVRGPRPTRRVVLPGFGPHMQGSNFPVQTIRERWSIQRPGFKPSVPHFQELHLSQNGSSLASAQSKRATPSDTQKTWPTPVLQHNCKVAGFHGTLRYVPRVGVPDGCRGHQMPGAGPLVAHLWLPVTSYPSQRQEAHRPEKSCPPPALVHKGRLGLWAGLVSALPNFTRLHVTDSSTVISFYRDYDD